MTSTLTQCFFSSSCFKARSFSSLLATRTRLPPFSAWMIASSFQIHDEAQVISAVVFMGVDEIKVFIVFLSFAVKFVSHS